MNGKWSGEEEQGSFLLRWLGACALGCGLIVPVFGAPTASSVKTESPATQGSESEVADKAERGSDLLILKDGRVFGGVGLKRDGGLYLVSYPSGEIKVPVDWVEDALIEGASSFEPSNEEEQAKFDKGLVPWEGRWVSIKRRDQQAQKKLEVKREEIKEALSHRVWRDRYITDTANFSFNYTLPENVCEGYRERMEAYFKIFCKEWRVKRGKKKGKLTVNFYGDRTEFNRTAGASGGTLAYFMFRGNYDLNVFYDRLDPYRTETILYHEANHYLQKLVNEDFLYPHWPGESLAEYYGASQWDSEKEKLTVGLIQHGRLAEVRNDMARGDNIRIRELISRDMYEDYSWGWSLVYFLMNDRRYEQKFRKFFVGLAKDKKVDRKRASDLKRVEGAEVLRYFQHCLGLKNDEDLDELEAEWLAYVRSLFEQLDMRGLEQAGFSALSTNQPIKAKRLLGEAVEAGSVNPRVFHRYATLLKSDGKRSEAIKHWRTAIALEPLTGSYYEALGKALLKGSKEDKLEGKALIALGAEIDPETDYEAWLGD